MMTNLMFDVADVDYENISHERLVGIEQTILDEVHALIHQARLYDKTLVLVSNEVGLGLVPPYKLGNYFRDISGRINQQVAALSDEVTFIAVGLPLKLNGGTV
jgi:adenosylcobinamide kinase/adenosylcobinamide-phosphate guanylyltransferase